MSARRRLKLVEPERVEVAAPVKELMDVREAAAFLKVSPGTIYKWAESRRIPCLRVGSKLRFVRDELVAWARGEGESHAQTATQHRPPGR